MRNYTKTAKGLDYGIVGNCRSAALISRTGSLDWLCLPDFSSPSVFARLLDPERGGMFDINAGPDACISQYYLYHTCILATHFETADGAFEVLDFMPRYKNDRGHYVCPADVVRFIRHLSGTPSLRIRYEPALCYGKHPTTTAHQDQYIKSWSTDGTYESIYLYSDIPADCILEGQAYTVTQDCYCIISYNQKLLRVDMESIILELERTRVYWMNWVYRTVSFAQYRNEIIRSAMVLKLLSYQKTGAILAAVTTSLPETIGSIRNWDYRFCWIRDASMIITVLTNIGHFNTAKRFLNFILDIIPYKGEKIQIMYGIHGEKRLTERELPWLRGYRNSTPVRVGNAAYKQKQNDIYGILLDVIHKAFELYGNDVEHCEELWTVARTLVRSVEENWQHVDHSIWEFRHQKRHFVFSKVLSWVAMDRGVKLAQRLERHAYVERWSNIRDAIHHEVLTKGWKPELGAFTQAYENDAMDAANLLMATYGFIAPSDPRYISTVERTRDALCRDGLMYRYRNEDDFGTPTSAFTVCGFWLVKSLCEIGRKREAREQFETMLGYANHLGLFSEDLDFETRNLLGNFPQGYSHLALIDAAIVLAETRLDENEEILNRIEHPQSD